MKPAKPKQSLSEAMADRIKQEHEVRAERVQTEKRSKFKKQEDEVMEMCYGPMWRTRYPGESVTKRATVVVSQATEDDDNKYEEYEDYDKAS
jgi:regulator of protease activity HflC (stomatin/prohibitin superfamily)